ncbi:CYTH domain-containing protein [Seohaeicola saemankumensis]|nr:CYTH domain-containing protein [Seohaeicola saemankumensis]MCA0873301.1 CYTH domain-containing protein [Seohaeicola saemankumensis]
MLAQDAEIERKFLVRHLPDLTGARAFQIRQGYLTGPADSVEVRLRQKDDSYFLTLKSDGDVVRIERESEITADQFATFWPQTDGRRVEKTRWSGTLPSGMIFELDEFSGALAPLILVEVEFTSERDAADFTPPDWFGRDVTSDKRFKNKSLALLGSPEDL